MAKARTTSDWDAVIEDLQERVHRARARLDEAEKARQPHRLAAAQGDAKAREELDRLSEDHRQAQVELSDLEGAVEQARAEREAAAEAERRKAEAERQRKLAKALERRRAAAERVDARMAELAEALEEFHASGREVMNLGRAKGLAHRAQSPSRLAKAAQHHGLNRHLPLERHSQHRAKPMIELDHAFSGAVRNHEPAE